MRPSNTCCLGLTRVHKTNGISTDSAVFTQLTAESIYFTMGHPFLPLKSSKPSLHMGFLGPTKSTTQTTGLTTVIVRQTDRQTDHAIASVTIGRIYVSAGFHKFLLEVRSRGVWRTKSPRNRSILASAKHYFVHNLQLVQNFTPSQQLQIINHLQKQQIPNVHVFGDRKMRLIKKTNGRNDKVSLMSV